MKKLSIILISFLIITTLSGAVMLRKKLKKTLRKKIIDDAIGDNAEVNIDGEKYSVKYSDGNTLEVASNEWPSGEVADIIPKFNKGTMTAAITVEGICSINIDNVEEKDFMDCFQKVKDACFAENPMNLGSNQTTTIYQAGASGEKYIIISYEAEVKHLNIMGSINEAGE